MANVDIFTFYALVGGCLAGGLIGSLTGMLAARHVHHSLILEVSDMLEKVVWLYDRIRKRTKLNGEVSDAPGVVTARPRTNQDVSRIIEARRREGG